MKSTHDHLEEMLDKLAASTRSPRGSYSAAESWKLLEKRVVSPRTKRLKLFRLAGGIAASVLLCLASWFIYDCRKLATMQTVSTGATLSVVTLPDQTKVTLNRYSSLTYPDRFKGDRRVVQLLGEAYFEVEKDARHPFIVKAEPVEIEVLGTHFNVEAYPADSEVRTLCWKVPLLSVHRLETAGLRFLPEKAPFMIEPIKHSGKKKQREMIRLPVGVMDIFILTICRCGRLYGSCQMLSDGNQDYG